MINYRLPIIFAFLAGPALCNLLPPQLGITAVAGMPSSTLPLGCPPIGSGAVICQGFNTQSPNYPSNGSLGPTVSGNLNGGIYSATMFAQSTYGILRASSSSSLGTTTSPAVFEADANAEFVDTVTINAPGFTGARGFLELGVNLDEAIATSGSASADVNLLGFACYQSPCLPSVEEGAILGFSSSYSGLVWFPLTYDFVYGKPFSLLVGLQTSATSFSTSAPSSATADASNTLILSRLEAVDVNGDPVSGVTFESGSGTVYTENGVLTPSPEPSSFAMLVIGAGILLVVSRRSFRVPGVAGSRNNLT